MCEDISRLALFLSGSELENSSSSYLQELFHIVSLPAVHYWINEIPTRPYLLAKPQGNGLGIISGEDPVEPVELDSSPTL